MVLVCMVGGLEGNCGVVVFGLGICGGRILDFFLGGVLVGCFVVVVVVVIEVNCGEFFIGLFWGIVFGLGECFSLGDERLMVFMFGMGVIGLFFCLVGCIGIVIGEGVG